MDSRCILHLVDLMASMSFKVLSVLLLLAVGASHSLAAEDSCSGRCGSNLDLSKPCQCNSHCAEFGDCCDDYRMICLGEAGGSCVNRCGQRLDLAQPCQCNEDCARFGDCCSDYERVCQSSGGGGSGGVAEVDLLDMGDVLWSATPNRFLPSELRINVRTATDSQTVPFFDFVDERRFQEPSYRLFIQLLDNYNHRTGQTEPQFTAQENQETEEYLQFLMDSPVMNELLSFFIGKGMMHSQDELRATLRSIWFDFYSRSSSSSSVLDSSGFEHVFVGEQKSSSVTGFHSWVQMYLLEKAGDLNYLKTNALAEPELVDNQFTWDGLQKARASMFVGTPPEFDLALYTLCFLSKPGSVCETSVLGNTIRIQSYDVGHVAGLQVASTFPMVNG